MGMTREEVLVKLNMDASQLDEQTKKSMAQLSAVAKDHRQWWQHAGQQGRAYRKVLEDVASTSPIMGNALRIALDPIVGIMLAAGAAFTFVISKVQELNAELDKTATENLNPISDKWEEQRELAKGVNASIEDQNKWLREQRDLHRQILKSAMDRFHIHKMDAAAIREAAMHAEKVAASKYIEAPEHADVITANRLESASKKQLDAAITKMNALKVASSANPVSDEAGFRLFPNWQEVKDMASGLIGKKGLADELKAAEESVKSLTFEYHKNASNADKLRDTLDKLKTNWEESKTVFTSLDEALSAQLTYEKQLSDLKRNQQHERDAPYIPGLGDLASTNTPYGFIARELQAAQRNSKYALGLASPGEIANLRAQGGAAYADLMNEGGAAYRAGDARGLAKAYQKYGERMQALLHGRSSMDYNMEVAAKAITDLNDRAKDQGLIVRGPE